MASRIIQTIAFFYLIITFLSLYFFNNYHPDYNFSSSIVNFLRATVWFFYIDELQPIFDLF